MATTITTTEPSLPGFIQLNSSVYFRKAPDQPTIQPSTPTPPQPDLILLLSWGGAPLRLIQKYTTTYATLYPSSPLLLVQTEFSHILRHTSTSQDVPLAPALDILDSHIQNPSHPAPSQPPPPNSQSGRVLVHLFSNGGSYKLLELARRYRIRHRSPLPIVALILDSAPGVPTIGRSFKAISFALPKVWLLRWPLQVVLICFLVIHRLLERFVLGDGGLRTGRRLMNDGAMIAKQARRWYIYGPRDELVGSKDVREHAAEARASGYEVVEEVFPTTPHVAHMRGDPERYWAIVKRVWESCSAS